MHRKGVYMALRYAVYDTLAGDVTIISKEKALSNLIFGVLDPAEAINEENICLYDAIMELNQFFFGQRHSFDIPLDPDGTPFEKKVYEYVSTIPYGSTKTYEEVAEAVGEPRGARAVLMALNRNPLPVFIPCHRVVGKSGEMMGYVGGLELKKKLLHLEAANLDRHFGNGSFVQMARD
ncbi:MAG TPA: cysteine methyltransferase [Firmicutes bacterium]|nr:cysteine methyltransferase [Bacillota bacterium]